MVLALKAARVAVPNPTITTWSLSPPARVVIC